MSWLLAPYADVRTPKALAYLLLGLPLGIFGFTVTVTGLAVGIGTIVTLLGVPVLVVTLLFVRAFATFERRLAWSLLDAPMPRRAPEPRPPGGVFWARLRALVTSRRTRSELAFVLLRLPLGIADFVVAVTIVSLMLVWAVEPILVAAGVEDQIGSWTIDTFAESLVAVPIGLLFVLVGPRLLLGWSAVSARIATGMLGRIEPEELKAEVAAVLTRAGELDAFQILDELTLRFGRGPFVTPVKVEATLLALESNGRLRTRRDGRRTIYALA